MTPIDANSRNKTQKSQRAKAERSCPLLRESRAEDRWLRLDFRSFARISVIQISKNCWLENVLQRQSLSLYYCILIQLY